MARDATIGWQTQSASRIVGKRIAMHNDARLSRRAFFSDDLDSDSQGIGHLHDSVQPTVCGLICQEPRPFLRFRQPNKQLRSLLHSESDNKGYLQRSSKKPPAIT